MEADVMFSIAVFVAAFGAGWELSAWQRSRRKKVRDPDDPPAGDQDQHRLK